MLTGEDRCNQSISGLGCEVIEPVRFIDSVDVTDDGCKMNFAINVECTKYIRKVEMSFGDGMMSVLDHMDGGSLEHEYEYVVVMDERAVQCF